MKLSCFSESNSSLMIVIKSSFTEGVHFVFTYMAYKKKHIFIAFVLLIPYEFNAISIMILEFL